MNETTTGVRPLYTIRQQSVRLGATRPLRVQPLDVPQDVSPHDHDYYEICLVRHGQVSHRTDAGRQTIAAGWVIVMPPGETHAFHRPRSLAVTNVYYLSEWLLNDLRSLWDQDGLVELFLRRSLLRRNPLVRVPQFCLSRAESIAAHRELDELRIESESPAPSMLLLRASFTKFLILLSRAFVRQCGREMGFSFRPEVRAALDELEQWLADRKSFSQRRLAQAGGLSPGHFAKLFKADTGWRPTDYYQRRRVQQASLLLMDPRRSITDVAYELGYADAAHFSRLFRRWRGLSPRQHRNIYR